MNRILNGIIVILFSSMLVGCGAENLSEKYNKDELEKLSKEIVTLINEKEYEEVFEKGSDFLKKEASIEDLKKGHELIIENFGEFEEFKEINFQEKNGYAIVINKTKYKNKEVNYITTFGEDLKLEEFRMM